MKNSYLQLLQTKGYSIIPCSSDKRPIGSWKKYQSQARTLEEIGELNSPLYGIVMGYGFTETIDVDLKVFSTAIEQREWWDEYLGFLKDNILDFEEKFVIKKTYNNGYHILYKSKRVQGNTKIASLKGHNEAIIESRGIGGMVIVYDNTFGKLDYQDVQFISDEDREILWACSKYYDYKKPVKQVIPKKERKQYESKEGDITPWDDFNNKNNVWDIVSDEFSMVKNLNKKYIIKRNGAESAHSGYIYKDEDLMYLFSTGTRYEHEKQYSAWTAHVRKHFNDDFSAAASQAYKDGYGSRLVKKKPVSDIKIQVKKENIEFPIDIFPSQIQDYILQCNETLNHSIDYMGCSLLWLISVSIGNALKVEIVPGWTENSTVWMAIVGKPGWGKTPSIKRIISPLQKYNSREVKKYYKELDKFDHYDGLTKKEKEAHPEVNKPKKNQFIANDITLEALVDLHHESDNSVGVFKDELAGWFKDMNKYREGSDLEFWLSCWSSSPVILTRVTRKGSFIERPSIPVLGGIQPDVMNGFNTAENRQNGFMDRILLCYPDLKSQYLSKNRMKYEDIEWFKNTMVRFFEVIKDNVVKRDKDEVIEPLISVMSDEAYEIYDNHHRNTTDIENDDQENEYLKSMLPKQKAYIARFSLLIHVFDNFFIDDGDALVITPESINKSIKLSNYFIAMAKKVKTKTDEVASIKSVIDDKKLTIEKKIEILNNNNPNFNKSETAQLLGVSRQTIYNILKK